MPAPRFITSESFGAAGLYIQEVAPPATVQGEQSFVVGIVGQCVKGPVDKVVEVSSEQEFRAIFGGRAQASGSTLVGEVWKALVNKRFNKLAIVRAAAAAAVTADKDFDATVTPIIDVAARNPGAWGNDIRVTIADATDGNANHFNLTATWGEVVQTWRNLDVSATGVDNLPAVIGDSDANLIVATKLADGRPDNIVNSPLDDTAGADGTIADTDFTGAGGPIELLTARRDLKARFVAGRSTTAVKAKINTDAPSLTNGVWLICPDNETIAKAAAETEVNGLTRSDRLVYCYNHARTFDPETATLIVTEPHAWMASILSQTDADVHPGLPDNRRFTAGIRELTQAALTDSNYDDFRTTGICALERNNGFLFVDGVVTDRTPGKESLSVRLQKDFLIHSIARFLSGSVKRTNLQDLRDANKAAVFSFLAGLARAGRYVDLLDDDSPAVEVDTEKLNTEADRAAGTERMLVRVKLIAHAERLLLKFEGGTTVQIAEAA